MLEKKFSLFLTRRTAEEIVGEALFVYILVTVYAVQPIEVLRYGFTTASVPIETLIDVGLLDERCSIVFVRASGGRFDIGDLHFVPLLASSYRCMER